MVRIVVRVVQADALIRLNAVGNRGFHRQPFHRGGTIETVDIMRTPQNVLGIFRLADRTYENQDTVCSSRQKALQLRQ
jgi:hypothetical protein